MNRTFLFAVSVLLAICTCEAAPQTEAELLDAIVGKYYDAYFLQPDKIGNFQIGSAYTDRFHQEGLVRIVMSLPDGTQKSFDFDDRFSTAKPTKIEPVSDTGSRLSFAFGEGTVSVTSTTYLSRYCPSAYQVWRIDKP